MSRPAESWLSSSFGDSFIDLINVTKELYSSCRAVEEEEEEARDPSSTSLHNNIPSGLALNRFHSHGIIKKFYC